MSIMRMVSVVIHVVNCRKAKAELQDGFQLSYQPTPLNQLQDGGDNLINITVIIIIININIFIINIIITIMIINNMIIIMMQVPFSNMSQQPVEMQKTMQKTKVSHLFVIKVREDEDRDHRHDKDCKMMLMVDSL